MKLNSKAMRFLQRRGLPAGSNANQVRRFVLTLSQPLQQQLISRDANVIGLLRGNAPASNLDEGDDEDDVETTETAPVASGRRGANTPAATSQRASQPSQAAAGSAPSTPETPATATTVASPADETRTRQEERARIRAIRELATPEIPQHLVDRACDDGWSADEAGRRFYQHIRRQSNQHAPNFDTRQDGRGPGIHSRRGVSISALQGALMLRNNISLDAEMFQSRGGQAMLSSQAPWVTRAARSLEADESIPGEVAAVMEDAHRYRNRSLIDICRMMLRAGGHRVPSDPDTVVERSFTSSDLRVTFGPVIIAQILQGYMEYPDSTVGWVDETEWNDFRENNMIQIDPSSQLKRHVRNKEAPPIELNESVEKYSVNRYVGMFQLDDMDIVNDMFGATPDLPNQLGRMARELRPDLVCAILMSNPALADTVALFHATHANVATSAALAQATVQTVEGLIAKQTITSSEGLAKALNLKAGHLFVPRSLRLLAKRLIGSEMLTDAAGNLNALRGEFNYSADARLDNGVVNPLTGAFVTGSATTWYMAAAGGKHGLQIGYRRGTGRAPRVLTKPLNVPGKWGIGWDVAMDIGIGIANFRGLARATA